MYSPFYALAMEKEYKEGVFKGPVHESIKGLEETLLEQKNVRELEKRVDMFELENALFKKACRTV